MSHLRQQAKACLDCCDPEYKVRMTRQLWQDLQQEKLYIASVIEPVVAIPSPGRPKKPTLVSPRDLPKRTVAHEKGRAALLHAVAHIEFNAINLAWDAVYRFQRMPEAYYRDWASIAHDEARHFTMLCRRLGKMGIQYGDFDAHDGLWEMACKTAHHATARMALVPRVLEARGLDVTPAMMARFQSVGDTESVAVLEVILREEVAHVEAGTRWFHWCCEQEGIEPESTFRHLLQKYMRSPPHGPYNIQARKQAGFSEAEIAWLESN